MGKPNSTKLTAFALLEPLDAREVAVTERLWSPKGCGCGGGGVTASDVEAGMVPAKGEGVTAGLRGLGLGAAAGAGGAEAKYF